MGLLRVILAIAVIAGHTGTSIFGLQWLDAFYAVQVFFTISGFYMALVLDGKYNRIPIFYFYRSRALRIYPTYFISTAAMLMINIHDIRSVFRSLSPFSRAFMTGENLAIFGQDLSYIFCMRERSGDCITSFFPTIVPPAWSLSVELGFYLIAPFVVRDTRRILAFIGVGMIYHLLALGIHIPDHPFSRFFLSPFSLKYYFYPSSFIFFGVGALSYHRRRVLNEYSYVLLIIVVIAFAYIDTPLPPWNLIIFAFAIPEIFKLTRSSRIDRMIGEFSYPLYVLHWPILTFVQGHAAYFSAPLRYATVGTLVALMSATAAFMVYLAVDRPLDRLRHPPETALPEPLRETAWSRAMLVAYVSLPFAILAAIALST